MELIKEPNPAFNKSLFLESLAGLEDPIKIRINYVGNVFISKMNGSPNFFVEMEILTDFPNCKVLDLDLIGRTQYNEDGSKKDFSVLWILFNVSWESRFVNEIIF